MTANTLGRAAVALALTIIVPGLIGQAIAGTPGAIIGAALIPAIAVACAATLVLGELLPAAARYVLTGQWKWSPNG